MSYIGNAPAQNAVTQQANIFTKPQTSAVLSLSSNTVWDGTDKQHLTVSVNGSTFIIANPSAQTNGAYYAFFVTYVTANTISFGTAFKGIADVSPSATAGAYDHYTFRSNGTYLMLVGASYNIGA